MKKTPDTADESANSRSVTCGIDKELLDILACPACRGDMKSGAAADFLYCLSCSRRYPVKNGIPILIIEKAELPSKG